MNYFKFIFEKLLENDYRINHIAPGPEGSNSLDDMSDIFPDDIYSNKAVQYYGNSGNMSMDRESIEIIQKNRNKPNAKVFIYRAVPKDIKDKRINPGDWVTISKKYATEHGKRYIKGGMEILQKSVKAKELFTDGNSIHEWGYHP